LSLLARINHSLECCNIQDYWIINKGWQVIEKQLSIGSIEPTSGTPIMVATVFSSSQAITIDQETVSH